MDDINDVEAYSERSESDSQGSDAEFGAIKEDDQGEQEDIEFDEICRKADALERLADEAPPVENAALESTAPLHERKKQLLVSNKKRGPKNPKGRGPTKGLVVKEAMHLEYDNKGQPYGKWRAQYGKHVGHYMRKLSILDSWSEVPEALKKTLWEDMMNLFHIEANEAKKNVFLSTVAQRFRDFKSKLVSGWITLKRPRTSKKKRRRDENGEGEDNENEQEPPKRKPYEIWPHITQDVWNAFVAKKTTGNEVAKCEKASASALKRKFYHHLGPKTYEQKRKEWMQERFYPSCSSSVASDSTTTKVKTDRVWDWWCSLHAKDEHGNRRIADPDTKKVADAVVGWKNKEAAGEFSPEANKDALYMVMGKDHYGRVKGQGGIRLGLRKAFEGEYSVSKSTVSVHTTSDLEAVKSSLREEVRQEVMKEVKTLLKQVGIAGIELNEDAGTHLKPTSEPEVCSELIGSAQFIPEFEEETFCELLLPKDGENEDELIVVADGHVKPTSDHVKVHFKEVAASYWRVGINDVRDGCLDRELPVPRQDVDLVTLGHARGSFVAWPCRWVQFSDEITKKQKEKVGRNEKCEGARVDGDKKKMQKNEVEKRIPSKGSNTLLDQQAVDSLSQPCYWLHECTRKLVDGNSIVVFLDKNQFHYDEDTSTYLTREDVCEFLCGKMLNVSFIQLFMSALYADLVERDSLSRIGWLCPQEIRGAKCLADSEDVKFYLEQSMKKMCDAGKTVLPLIIKKNIGCFLLYPHQLTQCILLIPLV